ncbi:hypothetical protein CB0940_10666 [Cercospora beticola]|uniref:Uncharacterized protein n=1 Tax=Cercospora beticola TaxID=122368 RepID=A0A2G5HV58_CERBT|nr:hypothetical protein CB0940_10666 [Cercospora beticola]PIA96173.1 hypothetical protein CB0940_10666 [Cercospora beticola]WPB07393.1 hypothetical protein RHO25_012054 [Cercospora beticola]
MAATCQALNLSDEQKCSAEATSANGLFCRFHAKQAYGLYRGYKLRNATFDHLDANPPAWLSGKLSDQVLRNISFADVEDENTLNEVHDHLFKRYALLDRVIRARKLHQQHFYPLDLDYGHKAYVDKLTNERFVTLRALERLEKRAAEVLHAQKKWFKFVRQQQEEEEEARENESKQIKREAALFRRYVKDTQARMARKRQRENQRRQEAHLNEAYKERQNMSEDEEQEQWDPIEDELEEDREKFIDIMRRLLWLTTSEETLTALDQAPSRAAPQVSNDTGMERAESQPSVTEIVSSESVPNNPSSRALTSNKVMNRNQKKRAKKQAKAQAAPADDVPSDDSLKIEVNETAEQIGARLLSGEAYDWRGGVSKGGVMAGTMEHPAELHGKILGLPQDEVDKLIEEIGEIKQLLLCRLILGQAALLPAALRASSLQEFFLDPEVNATQLRDLCLRLEQPSLQELRDACADFARGELEDSDDEVDEDEEDEQEAYDRSIAPKPHRLFRKQKRALPDYWKANHEKQSKKRTVYNEGATRVDFGDIDDNGQFQSKKIRIRVCGKTIWNYPSERSVSRRGWLHFSIIAKGTKLGSAIQLCRNWNEFYELNILALFGYFPNAAWGEWAGDSGRSRFLLLGFIPRFTFFDAHRVTTPEGGPARGAPIVECKNVICAHIKRNDPVSRRFIQYLMLFTSELCILVRDAKTGHIILQPPKEEQWLARTYIGGRWKITGEVNEEMLEQFSDTHAYSDFRFGFDEHYDLIIWDLEPGEHWTQLESRVHDCLIKAHRLTKALDGYYVAAPILKTVHRDHDSMRCRDVRPGEMSIFDDMNHPGTRSLDRIIEFKNGKQASARDMTTKEIHEKYYNEIDAAEDEILFPEELQGLQITAIGDHADRINRELEAQGPSLVRFVNGLDTDDDSDADPDLVERLNRPRLEAEKKSSRPQLEAKVKSSHAKPSKSLALRQKNAAFNGNQIASRSGPVGKRRPKSAKEFENRLREAGERVHDWQKEEDKCPNDFAPDCECAVCAEAEGWEEYIAEAARLLEDDTEGSDWSDSDIPSPEALYEVCDADLEAVESDPRELKRLKTFVFGPYARSEDIDKQFWLFTEREKAKAFKPQIHAADIEPGAMERYAELQQFQEESRRVNAKCGYMRGKAAQTQMWLNVHQSEHRLVFRDLEATYAFVGLFFPADREKYGDAVADWRQNLATRTKLVDNQYKATQLPYYRDWRSDELLPKDFWPPCKNNDAYIPLETASRLKKPPREWDALTRPIIARLYKAGIISPSPISLPCGRAIAREDPMTGEQRMFIDFRKSLNFRGEAIGDRSHITDFRAVDLLGLAREHNMRNTPGKSHFALLRVYSHPMFWPVVIGFDTREYMTFEDCRGRAWSWKFYPKDAAGSQWSFQNALDSKLKRWRPQLGKNVQVRRDIVLVMGNTREELEQMMLGTVFALQTANWRNEVDFWRSFVDVDFEFLDNLDKKWLE